MSSIKKFLFDEVQGQIRVFLERKAQLNFIVTCLVTTDITNGSGKRHSIIKQPKRNMLRLSFGFCHSYRHWPFVRPVPSANLTVKVYFELYIAQLIKVDEVSQIMETKLWLKQRWNDYKLRWNYSEYDMIKNIRVPSDDIWKPDIVLYNTAMGDFHVKQNTKAIISYDGEITWMPPDWDFNFYGLQCITILIILKDLRQKHIEIPLFSHSQKLV